MRRKIISFLFVFLLLNFLFSVFSSPILGYYTNMSASVVLGQSDFISSIGGTTQTKLALSGFSDVFVDPAGRLIVADDANSRVLIWNSVPSANNAPANLVLGQSDFTTATQNTGGRSASSMNKPKQVYSDGNRLFVADRLNGRVLIWNTFPNQNGQPADVVVGQSDFATTTQLCTQSNFDNRTGGVWVYNNKLIVFERNQMRVLIWNNVPTTNYAPADVVLGHADFTTCSLESISASSIGFGAGMGMVKVDSFGRLYVVDSAYNRILVWNSIPTENNKTADIVIGQPDFTTSSSGTTASKLSIAGGGGGIYSNASRIFISDSGNNRVLIFNSIPSINGASADIVLGQTGFTNSSANGGGSVSASGFNFPVGVFEYNTRLIISEDNNDRILIFNNTISTPGISLEKVERLSDGKYQVKGNVKVGEAGHYDLGGGGGVSFSVNGVDGSGVTALGNQMSDGGGSLYYDFTHTFEPWTNNGTKEGWSETRGFTLRVSSKNSNTDSSSAFWFEPFKAVSLGGGVAKFSVGKYQITRIKDNVSFFDVFVKKVPIPKSKLDTPWVKLLTNIPTSLIDSDGVVTSPLTNIQTSLSKGTYLVKVQAVSKDSNFRQDSQTTSVNLTSPIVASSYINPFNYQTNPSFWFPLQLTKSPSFSSPTISGIAFANSTVALRVTSLTTGKSKDYTTTTNSSSRFSLTPTIASSSILTLSVYDALGHYNFLTPITVTGEGR